MSIRFPLASVLTARATGTIAREAGLVEDFGAGTGAGTCRGNPGAWFEYGFLAHTCLGLLRQLALLLQALRNINFVEVRPLVRIGSFIVVGIHNTRFWG